MIFKKSGAGSQNVRKNAAIYEHTTNGEQGLTKLLTAKGNQVSKNAKTGAFREEKEIIRENAHQSRAFGDENGERMIQ